MFWHNFKYTFKSLMKNKALIFWTFAFPLILGAFFKMAFSNIENSETLDIIDIAVVKNDTFQNNSIYQEVFKSLSDEKNEDRLFNTTYTNLEEAKKMLEKKEITGYLLLEDRPKIVVATSGINETIFKSVVEEIVETEKIIQDISTKFINEKVSNANQTGEILNLEAYYQEIYQNIQASLTEQNIQINNISNKNLSYTMIEYYTLIAMTALYSGIIGMVAINNIMANMSSKGKRVSVSSASKTSLILSSTLASFLIQMIGMSILFLFTIFVLKVEYGNLPFVILLAFAGSFAGLTMGIAISCLLKVKEAAKTGIIISISMLCCFLSGMMGITMKYVIDKNLPLLNKINPGAMITDGLYSLYYYNTYNRYLFNVISLIIFALILLIISSRSLRRQEYDHI